MSLVNKFNARPGDLVLLESEKLDAGGFVMSYSPHHVLLSHEDPFSKNSHRSWDPHRLSFCIGDKDYSLCKFDSYKVLKEREVESEKDQDS